MSIRIRRLSPADLSNLAMETADAPMHLGAVAILDARPLINDHGGLYLDRIRSHLAGQLNGVPELRRVLYRPGLFAGRPLWIDDGSFRIDRHVSLVTLAGPNPDEQLYVLAERLLSRRLDRSHPMWHMWFATGLSGGRVGVVIALHHSIADGAGAMALIGSLCDTTTAVGVNEPLSAPRWCVLVQQNLRERATSWLDLARAGGWRRRLADAAAAWRLLRHAWRAPRTSLNAPVGPRRQLDTFEIDLAAVRSVARAHSGTVNDVVLTIAAGGLGDLLRGRGERTAGVSLHAAVAASSRAAAPSPSGNNAGIIVARLPIDEPDPTRRLARVREEMAAVKGTQRSQRPSTPLAWLSRSRLARSLTRRQRMTNVIFSNVVGPTQPISLVGARVRELIPVGVLAGNLTVAVLALSCAGRLTIAVRVDADAVPDLPVLMAGMRRDWATLSRTATGDAQVSAARLPADAERQARLIGTCDPGPRWSSS